MPSLRILLLLFFSLFLIQVSTTPDSILSNLIVWTLFLLSTTLLIFKFYHYGKRRLTFFLKYGRHLWWYHFWINWRIARERWQARQLQRIIDESRADLEDNHDLSQKMQGQILENIEHWKNQLKVHHTFRRLYEEERLKLQLGKKELLLMRRCLGRMHQRRFWRLFFHYYVEYDPLERFQSATHFNQRVDRFAREQLGKDTEQFYGKLDVTARRERLRRVVEQLETD